MRSILFLLLTPAIAYGALYGYLWYETKSQIERLAASVSPFAQLSYDNIHISPMGDEVGLNNIMIIPVISPDSFRIEQLRIKAPHVGHFLKLAGSSVETGLPENMPLQLSGVHIDLDSNLFTQLEQMQAQAAMMNPKPAGQMMFSPDALGCGNRTSFSLSDYSEMGLQNLVADITADNWYNPQLDRTNIRVDTNVRGLYTVNFTIELNGPPREMAKQVNSSGLPRTHITYRDTGYYKHRNKFCAVANNTSIDNYIEQNIELLTTGLGATFPKESIGAYRKFMYNGGSLAIRLAPTAELPLDGLSHYKPSDIIDMLGLSLRIDNTPVALDKIEWSGQPISLVQQQSRSEERQTANEAQNPIPPRELLETRRSQLSQRGPSYHVIRVEQAPKYLNRLAEVTTADGRVREGILKEADNIQLTLVMRVGSGTLTYPVNLSLIDRLRVRY